MSDTHDEGQIILAAAPLGNPLDVTFRIARLLESVDLIAVEDTRKFRRLVQDCGITPHAPVWSFYEAVEEKKTPEILERVSRGHTVLVMSDAGMPTLSDPGFRLVQEAIAADIPVTVAPGPSAITTAMALSGLATDRFCFEGFLPKKHQAKRRALTSLATEQRTLVFFESPRRLGDTLVEMRDIFGDQRRIAVCRELTKTYEEVIRGTLLEVVRWSQTHEVRGEITMVVEGAALHTTSVADIPAAIAAMMTAGWTKKEAMKELAESTGLSKRDIYQALIDADQPSALRSPQQPTPSNNQPDDN